MVHVHTVRVSTDIRVQMGVSNQYVRTDRGSTQYTEKLLPPVNAGCDENVKRTLHVL